MRDREKEFIIFIKTDFFPFFKETEEEHFFKRTMTLFDGFYNRV